MSMFDDVKSAAAGITEVIPSIVKVVDDLVVKIQGQANVIQGLTDALVAQQSATQIALDELAADQAAKAAIQTQLDATSASLTSLQTEVNNLGNIPSELAADKQAIADASVKGTSAATAVN